MQSDTLIEGHTRPGPGRRHAERANSERFFGKGQQLAVNRTSA